MIWYYIYIIYNIYIVLYIPLDPYTTWLDTHIHEQPMQTGIFFQPTTAINPRQVGVLHGAADWRNRNVSRRQKICCVGRWTVCGRRLESRRWRLGRFFPCFFLMGEATVNGRFDGNFTVINSYVNSFVMVDHG